MTFQTLSIEAIIHEYEQLRMNNKRLLQDREEEIYQKFPRIEAINQESRLSYIKAARLRVTGGDANGAITREIKEKNQILAAEKRQLLVDAGYPADYLDPIYECPKCKDMGYIDQTRCSCFLDRMVNALYIQSNLNTVLSRENFNTFSLDFYSKEVPEGKTYSPYDNARNILNRAKTFCQNFSECKSDRGDILIYGETGLGKTFLTNCIAKELLDTGHSVLYLSANELFESVLADYLINRKTDLEDLYKYIYNSELLIIDDLGTEFTNNFVLPQLFEIINKRKLTGKSTLISTNLSMKQLRDRYSERIMSRIIADYTVFNFYGDNIRYQKRKQAIHANI